jgi:cytosine/adenosine deaminase-related metal-dependent hydrolase
MDPALLLKDGVVLIYDDTKEYFKPVATDVLVKDGIIDSIKTGIVAPAGCRVINCSNKILSPGFVDTHNHHWESPLKGICENLTAVSYFATSTQSWYKCYGSRG